MNAPSERLAIVEEEKNLDEYIEDIGENLSYVEPNDEYQPSCVLQRVLLTPKIETHP